MSKILFLLIILLLSVSAYSQVQVQSFGELYIIEPKTEYYKINEDNFLHVHVYDKLGNLLMPNTYDCFAHVYNSNNYHVLQSNMTSDINGVDKELNITNVTIKEGHYSYTISCEKGVNSGALSSEFIVTNTGYDTRNIVLFSILFGIMGIIGALLYIVSQLDVKIHNILRTFIILFIIYFSAVIPRTLAFLVNNSITSDLLKYYLLFLKIFSVYLLLYFMWSILEYYGKTTDIKRFIHDKVGNKGGR